MEFLFIQSLNGLAYATTLFLMAAGLTLIFGVTRIVNFAHGTLFMLGALVAAYAAAEWFPELAAHPAGYLGAMLLGALAAAVVGAVVEFLLLRRMYGVPELYQLVATFGLTLFLQDAMRWGFGPQEVFAPRFPGLRDAVQIGSSYFPLYQVVMIALGPLVWLGLHLLLTRTLFGKRLRAATQDRAMLSALGVAPGPLMLGAVVIGCALAGLAGALQVPREPAHLQMDMAIVVETFVVVVAGGLGSITGAFWAAMLIGQVHAFGIVLWPQATLVVVFLTMAVILAVRPHGLFGKADLAAPRELPHRFALPATGGWFVAGAVLVAGSLAAWLAGTYWQQLWLDLAILALFGLSLQAMMALGGLVSFGHAAFFGLGAYAAALVHTQAGAGLTVSLLAAVMAATLLAAVFGASVVRSSGVYLAMLSLALAQVVWATATQWVALTGGDNGIIGIRLVADRGPAYVGWYVLVLGVLTAAVAGLAWLSRSSFGAGLQAVRDAPARAAASGLSAHLLKYQAFVLSAALAGLAGGLYAAHKGAVFPSVASIAQSVDALVVVLLGGVHHVLGALAGALVLLGVGAEIGRMFDYWRGALGLLIMLAMVFAPSGLLGRRWWWRRRAQAAAGRHGASP